MELRQVVSVLFIAAFISSCVWSSKPLFSPPSEMSLGRMPSALETRLIDASYVPWDFLWGTVNPADIIYINGRSIQVARYREDCFPKLSHPKIGYDLAIQSVTIDQTTGSFALKFLELAAADLSREKITSFNISLTDLHTESLAIGSLNAEDAEKECRADLENEEHFAVSAVLIGKITLKFYGSDGGSVTGDFTNKVIHNLGLQAKGFIKSDGSDSVISKESRVLGFMVPKHTAEDLRTLILEKSRREIKEAALLNSYIVTEIDQNSEAQLYRVVTERKDSTHSFKMKIVNLRLGDDDFSWMQFDGTSQRRPGPLLISMSSYTTDHWDSHLIWDEKVSGDIGHRDTKVEDYNPVVLASMPVGEKFLVNYVSKDVNTFCQNNRPYDFYTFTGLSRYQKLEDITFVFLVKKSILEKFVSPPFDVLEMQEQRHPKGDRKMFLPRKYTDFIVDDIRNDYSEEAMDQLFNTAISKFKFAFPQEQKRLLKDLSSKDFNGYRLRFYPLDRIVALSFQC